MCVGEGESVWGREGESVWGREGERECVCVCVCERQSRCEYSTYKYMDVHTLVLNMLAYTHIDLQIMM